MVIHNHNSHLLLPLFKDQLIRPDSAAGKIYICDQARQRIGTTFHQIISFLPINANLRENQSIDSSIGHNRQRRLHFERWEITSQLYIVCAPAALYLKSALQTCNARRSRRVEGAIRLRNVTIPNVCSKVAELLARIFQHLINERDAFDLQACEETVVQIPT
jgi:hypothetical protein